VSEDDIRTITDAVESAKKSRLDLDKDLFDFLRDILLLRVRGDLETEWSALPTTHWSGHGEGSGRYRLYCFNRLVSLNEVEAIPTLRLVAGRLS
jgi:(1->4)-alpha-D-glucan 1-alpha-D-glucosylmutase